MITSKTLLLSSEPSHLLQVTNPRSSASICVGNPPPPSRTSNESVASCTRPVGATRASLLPTSSTSVTGSFSVTVDPLNAAVASELAVTPSLYEIARSSLSLKLTTIWNDVSFAPRSPALTSTGTETRSPARAPAPNCSALFTPRSTPRKGTLRFGAVVSAADTNGKHLVVAVTVTIA